MSIFEFFVSEFYIVSIGFAVFSFIYILRLLFSWPRDMVDYLIDSVMWEKEIKDVGGIDFESLNM